MWPIPCRSIVLAIHITRSKHVKHRVKYYLKMWLFSHGIILFSHMMWSSDMYVEFAMWKTWTLCEKCSSFHTITAHKFYRQLQVEFAWAESMWNPVRKRRLFHTVFAFFHMYHEILSRELHLKRVSSALFNNYKIVLELTCNYFCSSFGLENTT